MRQIDSDDTSTPKPCRQRARCASRRRTEIENRSRLYDYRSEAIQQALARGGVNEIDRVEPGGGAIKASLNISGIEGRGLFAAHVINRSTLCLSFEPIEAWHAARSRDETPCMHWSSLNVAVLEILTSLSRRLERAVMPNACVFCGTTRQIEQRSICVPCYDELPWNSKACRQCAKALVADVPIGVVCAACQQTPPPFTCACAPLLYEFPVDAALKALKFRRRLFYVPAFADILVQAMQDLPSDVDALLPVPLHWRRQAVRGFNQASELAGAVSRVTGLPVLKGVVRHRATPYQSGLAAAHRQRNLRAAFAVRAALRAHHVLIVDDVVTTGETCRQLARTLHDAGVKKTSVLAVARA